MAKSFESEKPAKKTLRSILSVPDNSSELAAPPASGVTNEEKNIPPPSFVSTPVIAPTPVISEVEDPEEYVLKSYYMKNRRINDLNNLLHLKKASGDTWLTQKQILDMVLEAGFKTFGTIPERPDSVKKMENERKRKK